MRVLRAGHTALLVECDPAEVPAWYVELANRRELPSEGVVLGAVQVPAGGQPLIFLADHPTTGGYPVVGVLTRPGVDAIGQARPGTRVRFRIAG